MMLLLSRVLFTLAIAAVAGIALHKVWTKNVDVLSLLKGPSDAIPVIEEQIVLHPQSLDFPAGEWTHTRLVEVRNTSQNETAYSIWLKIWSEQEDITHKEIGIEKSSSDGPGLDPFGDINSVAMPFVGRDPAGHGAIYLLLHRLTAMESRTFKFARIGGDRSKPLLVTVEQIGFSPNPPGLVKKGTEVGIQITPPEQIVLHAIGVSKP